MTKDLDEMSMIMFGDKINVHSKFKKSSLMPRVHQHQLLMKYVEVTFEAN